ncbi:MAG: hypothetical protein GIW99_08815 [Candidatus Eremiobacteraeota bacterium]|nr:hypothetical protein [Candidatus Eremiobacteraeota bacterium]MBC5827765.1 hypothetical protein [Candidatus Eremiobacteraeota bacterium]
MSSKGFIVGAALCGAAAFAAACGGGSGAFSGGGIPQPGNGANGALQESSAKSQGLPHPDHVTVLIMENENYSVLMAAKPAYLINTLKPKSAWFTQAYGVAHKSQPDYFALFAGTTEGLSGGGNATDACPPKNGPYKGDVASESKAHGLTFTAQVENSLPWGQCNSTIKDPAGTPLQVNRHTPWVNFSDVSHSVEHNWATGTTPDVSANITFLTPNQMDNMHDSTINYGDNFLSKVVPGIISYDNAHNGLLVIVWDEADNDNTNGGGHIATLLVGPMVKSGEYGQTVNHYDVLRTIEDMKGLNHLGNTGNASAITGVWTGSTPAPSPSPSTSPDPDPSPSPSASPNPSPTPTPSSSPGEVDPILESMIDGLQHDATDYSYHRLQAITALDRVRADLGFPKANKETGETRYGKASDLDVARQRNQGGVVIYWLTHDAGYFSGNVKAALIDMKSVQQELAAALVADGTH